MGMYILLLSLGMLFASGLLGYVVIRVEDSESWPPPGMSGLPWLLVISTFLIVISSGSMWFANRSAINGSRKALQAWMLITLVLGLSFLVFQVLAWLEMSAGKASFTEHLYAWSFYFLTALHAAHLIGGLIPMLIVTARSFGKGYSPENHRGVTYLGMYWHFLDGAWVLLFLTLIWGSGGAFGS